MGSPDDPVSLALFVDGGPGLESFDRRDRLPRNRINGTCLALRHVLEERNRDDILVTADIFLISQSIIIKFKMGDQAGGMTVKPERVHTLRAEQELRLEIQNECTLKLTDGSAEIFGHEIALNQSYQFQHAKLAIFTWKGCTLSLSGPTLVEYVAEETPQWAILNLHTHLEQLRETASEHGSQGPRVMVVGSSDSGKTSLCKTLSSYAFKRSRIPIFVDLDPADSSVTLPGSLSAMPIHKAIDPSTGYTLANAESTTTSGTSASAAVYYYGQAKPSANSKFFKLLITQLANTVNQRLEDEEFMRVSGCVIDTHGDVEGNVEGAGPETIVHAINEFQADLVIVLGHERLFFYLTKQLEGKQCNLIKFPKSGGVVTKTPEYKKELQNLKIREYFYGSPGKLDLSPLSTSLRFEDLKVFRVGTGSSGLAPSSALPLYAERRVDETQVFPIDNADVLLHSLLAVLDADEASDDLAIKQTRGFVYLNDFRENEGQVTMLVPMPGKFRFRYLLVGEYQWIELG